MSIPMAALLAGGKKILSSFVVAVRNYQWLHSPAISSAHQATTMARGQRNVCVLLAVVLKARLLLLLLLLFMQFLLLLLLLFILWLLLLLVLVLLHLAGLLASGSK
jgi:hypothetical protein